MSNRSPKADRPPTDSKTETDARVPWWLNFADPSLPEGQRFLGACIVPGASPIDAVRNAHALKCNPGGEVMGVEIGPGDRDFIDRTWMGRVLSRTECEAFSAQLLAKRAS